MALIACARRGPAVVAVALALFFAALLPARAAAQGQLNVPEAGLSLKMPPLQKVALVPATDPTHLRELRGWLGEKPIQLSVWLLPSERFGFSEPAELVDESEHRFAGIAAAKSFEFTERTELSGSFGLLGYAEFALGTLTRAKDSKDPTTVALVAFIAEHGACSIEIVLEGTPTAADLQAIRESLTQGVTVAGKPRDPRWSDAEAKQRWEHDAPAKVRKDPLKAITRTAHYIILTNSSSGDLFAKKMEENYAKIQAAFPFPERQGRRLMPVFLFKSKEDYNLFCEAMKANVGGVSKGHAWRDYYATWYESPNDPVHIHESTHQIFRNRLGLSGGGSWFQEGLAEYMCTKRDERNVTAQNVAKGKAVPLRKLMEMEALIAGGDAHANYLEASLLIEFLRESAATQAKFPEFVAKVGAAPRRSMAEIEAAIHGSLGGSIDELAKAFTDYCVKR